MKKRYVVLIILISLSAYTSLSSSLIAQISGEERNPQEVTLPNTELRTISSSFVSQEYKIQIFIPPAYPDTSKFFPVLYLLDADKSFGMARDIVDWLIWGDEIPQMLIVGIAYGEGAKQWWAKRSRDYTPSKDSTRVWGDWPLAGGGENFKKFIKNELIPFIDEHYRTSANDRTIAGLSFGGLFATYVLFTEPQLFSKYIISAPALLWDDNVIFRLEDEFAKKHDTLPAAVFCSIGELDHQEQLVQPWKEFVAIIEKRNYKKLKFTTALFKEETHFTVWPLSLTKGIKTLYFLDKP